MEECYEGHNDQDIKKIMKNYPDFKVNFISWM